MLIINNIEDFSYYGKSNYKYYHNSYSIINRSISYAIYNFVRFGINYQLDIQTGNMDDL